MKEYGNWPLLAPLSTAMWRVSKALEQHCPVERPHVILNFLVVALKHTHTHTHKETGETNFF